MGPIARSIRHVVLALAAVFALGVAPRAQVVFVDDSASGAANGNSWANAYTDLRLALQAAPDGAFVRVAQGTYRPDSGTGLRGLSFTIQNDVTSVLGGFAGVGAPNPNLRDPAAFPTILTGDLLGDDLPGFVNRGDNSHHVVRSENSGAEFVFAGFTVRGGNADGLGADAEGGGARLFGGIVLRNCTFEDNRADVRGGGVRGSLTRIDDCRFLGNAVGAEGDAAGGGLSGGAHEVLDSLFEGNLGTAAGLVRGVGFEAIVPLDEMLVEGCVFRGNTGAGRVFGAGVEVETFDELALFRACRFEGNVAPGALSEGGGARAEGLVRFEECAFVGNAVTGADARGGGLRGEGNEFESLRLERCVFVGNHSTLEGGGVAALPAVVLERCTITANTSDATDGGGVHAPGSPFASLRLRSSIVWANSTAGATPDLGDQLHTPGFANLEHSDVQHYAGVPAGTGMLALDPLFVDLDGADDVLGTADDDLRLLPGSPCIDAGSPLSPLDVDGTTADMGAFSFDQGEPPPPTWTDLGHALAGTSGAPTLAGTGAQLAGQLVTLTLSDALPLTISYLVAGFDQLDAPFKGGVMVPTVDFLLLRATSAAGGVELALPWPSGVPAGFETYWQTWVQDPAAPLGWAASNGLRGVAP